jgi:Protein of unknown function (DUF1566)
MRKRKKSMLALAIITAFMAAALFLPGLVSAGDLEPSAAPGPTMKTLDEIPPTWSQKLPASERFELVLDGEAVLDKETGLVWAKNANIADATKTWQDAMNYCCNISIANRKGWRLPTVEELASLVDTQQSNPALPSGHQFDQVQSFNYWSSTTCAGDTSGAWTVHLSVGLVLYGTKDYGYYVWPVRSDN